MRVEYVLLGLVALTSLQVSSGATCSNGLEGVQQSDICCAAECGTCGGGGCSERPGGQDSCCTSLIEASGKVCSDTEAAPCIIDDEDDNDDDDDEEGATCSNGLEGVQQSDICCAAECGACGGGGCSERPGGQDSCCTSLIEASGKVCSDTEAAPCIIDDEDDNDDDDDEEGATCSNGLEGVQQSEVCCAAECGTCGGSGCSQRPGGQDSCCSSMIKASNDMCSDTGAAPCIIDDDEDDDDVDDDDEVEEGTYCSNGLEGVQQSDICCAAECGSCGGSGCSDRPGGQSSCCTSIIEANGNACSSTNAAPCIIDNDDDDDEGPSPTPSPISIIPTPSTSGSGTVYQVDPDGNPMSLTDALDLAGPGDTISLADGLYREPIVTMNAGTESNPLVIKGGRDAVISAFSGDKSLMWDQKVVDIRHSWITLEGFTIDGHLNGLDEEDDYVDKCIWVEGQDAPTDLPIAGTTVLSSLIGFHVSDMHIHNCGMECIRMRNFVTNAVIKNNFIEDCGIYDFQYQFDGKIGEAVYIGTSSNQWTDGVGTRITNGPDGSNYNLVTGNEMIPRGNECVDVKEGASFNVAEYNECQEQLDEESGCYDSRGNENTFRYNSGSNCLGYGIRLGGHTIDGFVYGVDNQVYGNHFEDNEGGSIKAMVHPQGIICGNTCSGSCDMQEQGDDEEIEESWMADCPDDIPGVPFIDY